MKTFLPANLDAMYKNLRETPLLFHTAEKSHILQPSVISHPTTCLLEQQKYIVDAEINYNLAT